uniref:WxL domain-containing protein n=1 Tax=candidate division CPR3 bacterium TaxID=2268181 RepID=A0A7C5UU88_UNCC3
MKGKRKIASLAGAIGLLLWTVSFAFPVRAGTPSNVSDTMSRLQVSVTDVTHTIKFTPATAINQDDGVQITVPTNFGDTDLDVSDYSISQASGGTPCTNWTENTYNPSNNLIQFECDTSGAAGTGEITISITQDLDNPATVGEYEFAIATYDLGADGNFGGGDDTLEDLGYLSVFIVDDDTVNITGYIDTILSFDIDTSDTDEDCDAAGGTNPCDSHGGTNDNAGYVVDLGELSTTTVNDSGDTVMHADGLSGEINSIFFDLETNAEGGAAVTVVSLHESLYRDASNYIPSVDDGAERQITPGSGLYGINHPSGAVNSTTTGTQIVHDDCDADSGDDYYCDVKDGGTPIQIYNTNQDPVEDGRMEFEVGVSPTVYNPVGTYTDELTFVATATF